MNSTAAKLTKKAINEQFKPLSHALLHTDCKSAPFAIIAGWPVRGFRLYNARGCAGSAWNPTYSVGASNDGKQGTGGPRGHCVDWLYRHQRELLAA